MDGKSSYAGSQMWLCELRLSIEFLWIYTDVIKNSSWPAVVSRLERHNPLKEAPEFLLCNFSCVLFICCYPAMILFFIFSLFSPCSLFIYQHLGILLLQGVYSVCFKAGI